MPSASLAVAYRPSHAQPDKVCIAALSAAIALNLAALLVVMRPMAPQFAAVIRTTPDLVLTWITPKPIPPDPPPLDLQVRPKTPPATVPHALPKAPQPPVAVPTDQGNIAAPPVVPTIQPAVEAALVADPAPIEATLAYRTAPLSFPSAAIRRKLHGTVTLRVLVDAEGKPTQVVIDKSSGSELLDKSAREQVLANWRFQPATSQGHAVPAWARVPVSFELREL
ncbi:energy transducer TonB [Dyella sp. 2RAB6]|uniref:energy transducer TonB n=1 Tax=Dyella sp. 2RAB6 TaxID=3232992 RepID=UPI003F8E60FA